MHPALPRTTPAPAAAPRTAPRTVLPQTSRGAQHRAPGRALPARRTPRAVELDDANSAAVLTDVLAGLRAVPEKPVVDVRTCSRDVLRAVWHRIDFAGLALVGTAGVGASLVFTVVLLLWLASAGRLG